MFIKLFVAAAILIFALAVPLSAQTDSHPALITSLEIPNRTGTAYDLAWTPDGEWLAVLGGLALTMLDTANFEPAAPPIDLGEVLSIGWYPQWFSESEDQGGQLAYVGGYQNPQITLLDFFVDEADFEPHREIETSADQYVAAFRPDGNMLATLAGRDDLVIQLYNTRTDTLADEFALPLVQSDEGEYGQYDFMWMPDGETLMGAAADPSAPTVPLFFYLDTLTGDLETAPAPPQMQAFGLSPDGTVIAVVDEDGAARLLNAGTMESLVEFQSVEVPVSVRFSPDGAALAILSYHTTLEIWDISSLMAEQ